MFTICAATGVIGTVGQSWVCWKGVVAVLLPAKGGGCYAARCKSPFRWACSGSNETKDQGEKKGVTLLMVYSGRFETIKYNFADEPRLKLLLQKQM